MICIIFSVYQEYNAYFVAKSYLPVRAWCASRGNGSYPKPTQRNPEIVIASESIGSRRFIIERTKQNMAIIEVYLGNKKWATMIDQGALIGGIPEVGYSFYLSPNKRYLFVTKRLLHGVTVAFLYGLTGAHYMSAICPHQKRFDEAALDYYLKIRKINDSRIGNATRIIRMVRWHSGRLIFSMVAASYWPGTRLQPNDVSFLWNASFNLNTHRFRILRSHWIGLD